jgi:tetratricopeptide (TPR) repeat protein
MNGNNLKLLSLLLAVVLVAGCANKFKTSGKIAMGSQRWDKAISDFEKALEQTPEDGEIHFLMAKVYKEMGEFEKMIPHLGAADSLYPKGEEKIAELRQETYKQLFEEANTDTKNENYEEARDKYITAISIEPGSFGAYMNLGYVYDRLGDKEESISNFEKAYDLEPENIRVMENLAGMYFNQQKYAEAGSLYTIVLEKDPKHAEAMIRLAMIEAENGNYQKAVDHYNSALELEQDNCDVWFNLGVLYFQNMKDYEQALTAISRAVELCPEDVNAQVNLNVILISLERFDEAVESLENFTQEFPDECIGWDLYSQVLLRKGMRSQALEAENKYTECTEANK